MYRLRHQRQTSHPLHATEPAVLPVQDVEICRLSTFRVLHHDHDCCQYRGPHDEGLVTVFSFHKSARGQEFKCVLLHVKCFFFTLKPCQLFDSVNHLHVFILKKLSL